MIAQSAGCRGDVAGSLRNAGSMACRARSGLGLPRAAETSPRHQVRSRLPCVGIGLCADSGRVMISELIDMNRFVCGDDGLRHGVYERSR